MNRISVRFYLLAALAAAGVCMAGVAAKADNLTDKSDRFVAQQAATSGKSGWISLIVRFEAPLTVTQEKTLQAMGADVTRHLPFIQSAALRLPVRNLPRLA